MSDRRFSSYGPIKPHLHYYAKRQKLIDSAVSLLTAGNSEKDNPQQDGHYITVWAPRQCGKTWVMQEAVKKIKQSGLYDVGMLTIERAREETEESELMEIVMEKFQDAFAVSLPQIKKITDIPSIFTQRYFKKPVVLILDEFDALDEKFINRFAGVFRDMFISRTNEGDKDSKDKSNLLHGLALVGVRSVLGIENVTGSPFNVQRGLHIPNLTGEEVNGMFDWYKEESGQTIEQEVVDRLFYETGGQPGLTCWLGELLTEGLEDYSNDKTRPIGTKEFESIYTAATDALPNNNILNIISKAKQEPNRSFVLELFQTREKLRFRFDDSTINALYMNGVIDKEASENKYYVRFSSPFVQKRLFNYFSYDLFKQMGSLVEPLSNLDHVLTPTGLDIRELMKLYQTYLDKNKTWLFKDVPRRSDLRVYEAVYHFNLYSFLDRFFQDRGYLVLPEFPTGNGKIDLLIRSDSTTYGIELKSFTDQAGYRHALEQAAKYGKQLGLTEIFLVTFIEGIDDETRLTFEKDYLDPGAGIAVKPVFIVTGS